MNEQQAYKKAKEKVEAKLGFYIHLAVYIVINALLVVINLTTSTEYVWSAWPAFGWGIGILFHGLGVFAFGEGSALKEKMIEQELKKDLSKKL